MKILIENFNDDKCLMRQVVHTFNEKGNEIEENDSIRNNVKNKYIYSYNKDGYMIEKK